jgi:hypothetical protein
MRHTYFSNLPASYLVQGLALNRLLKGDKISDTLFIVNRCRGDALATLNASIAHN